MASTRQIGEPSPRVPEGQQLAGGGATARRQVAGGWGVGRDLAERWRRRLTPCRGVEPRPSEELFATIKYRHFLGAFMQTSFLMPLGALGQAAAGARAGSRAQWESAPIGRCDHGQLDHGQLRQQPQQC